MYAYMRCMYTCDLTCDVQRVCKKKCEALLHATSCMHARTRVRCNELHEFSESANSDTTGGYPPGGSVFALSAKLTTPPRAEFRRHRRRRRFRTPPPRFRTFHPRNTLSHNFFTFSHNFFTFSTTF
jgi:hypothetical protein